MDTLAALGSPYKAARGMDAAVNGAWNVVVQHWRNLRKLLSVFGKCVALSHAGNYSNVSEAYLYICFVVSVLARVHSWPPGAQDGSGSHSRGQRQVPS